MDHMKVMTSTSVIDFEKVVKLSYRESALGNGYPVEICCAEGGLFDSAVEIARLTTKRNAYQLVCAITADWAAKQPVFDIGKWLRDNKVDYLDPPGHALFGAREQA